MNRQHSTKSQESQPGESLVWQYSAESRQSQPGESSAECESQCSTEAQQSEPGDFVAASEAQYPKGSTFWFHNIKPMSRQVTKFSQLSEPVGTFMGLVFGESIMDLHCDAPVETGTSWTSRAGRSSIQEAVVHNAALQLRLTLFWRHFRIFNCWLGSDEV
mmetsp:Transcript_69061/g.122988  ORF Transcript_69061/g.122988 Transcript_69061/m.122988 type:complete len:160 (-) Transcript_69061:233-712(-)